MSTFIELPLELIQAAEDQPRKTFYQDSLEELSNSIRERGVLEPIVVRPKTLSTGEIRYEIVMGERRFRASHLAGKTHIPAIVRSLTDDEAAADALLENFQREDLNPIERARAIAALLEQMPMEKVGKVLGVSDTTLRRALDLLQLPELMQAELAERKGEGGNTGAFAESHARALLPLNAMPKIQSRLMEKIKQERLSVAQVEQTVAAIQQYPQKSEVFLRVGSGVSEQMIRSLKATDERRKPYRPQTAHEQLKVLDKQVTGVIDTIDPRIVEFLGMEDMNRLLALLTRAAGHLSSLAEQVRGALESADYGFRELYIHCPLCGRIELVGALRCSTCFTVLRRCADCGHFDPQQSWCREYGTTIAKDEAEAPTEEAVSYRCSDFQPRYVPQGMELTVLKAA
jgi:ParB family transcriptional regulator, chromosome partitioning protein